MPITMKFGEEECTIGPQIQGKFGLRRDAVGTGAAPKVENLVKIAVFGGFLRLLSSSPLLFPSLPSPLSFLQYL